MDEISKDLWTTKVNDQIKELGKDILISNFRSNKNDSGIEIDAALQNILGIISYNFEELGPHSLEYFINACEISSSIFAEKITHSFFSEGYEIITFSISLIIYVEWTKLSAQGDSVNFEISLEKCSTKFIS